MNKVSYKEWAKSASKEIGFKEVYYLMKALLNDGYDENEIIKPLIAESLNMALKKRQQNIPLSKIIQKKWFMENVFLTNETTLDPRPETEFLFEKINNKPRSVLELGVGTGCVILSILKKYIKCKGVGIDICEKAILVAKKNACYLKLNKKVKFLKNNWAFGVKGEFDLIVSNPPYVDKNLNLDPCVKHDPEIALFGCVETYKEIFKSLSEVKFKQMLLEVPDYLKNYVKNELKIFFPDYSVNEFNVYNSNIYFLDVFL